jgi:hypothetical protein
VPLNQAAVAAIPTFSPRKEDQIVAAAYTLLDDAATRRFLDRVTREAGLCPVRDHRAWSDYVAAIAPWLEDILLAGVAAAQFAQRRHPRQHHKHMKSTNMLERLNEEIRRRARVARIFPNLESCLRLVRALAVEIHEGWLEASRYLNMDLLREHKKEQLR